MKTMETLTPSELAKILKLHPLLNVLIGNGDRKSKIRHYEVIARCAKCAAQSGVGRNARA